MLATKIIQDQAFKVNSEQAKIMGRNGTWVTVRPVQPRDVSLIEQMHERLSKDSVYFRYLGPRKPATGDFQDLCSMGKRNGMVIVATVDEPGEKIFGIACYRIDPANPTLAEPAILVEDDYQGCGLGKQIVSALCRRAIQAGVNTFVSYIHPVNQRVLRMIQSSGLPYECRYTDGLKKVSVRLSPGPNN